MNATNKLYHIEFTIGHCEIDRLGKQGTKVYASVSQSSYFRLLELWHKAKVNRRYVDFINGHYPIYHIYQ